MDLRARHGCIWMALVALWKMNGLVADLSIGDV